MRSTVCAALDALVDAVAPPGGRGEASPLWVDVQKLCNMCVLSGRRAKSHVDTQTIQPGLGGFVL